MYKCIKFLNRILRRFGLKLSILQDRLYWVGGEYMLPFSYSPKNHCIVDSIGKEFELKLINEEDIRLVIRLLNSKYRYV